MKEGPGRTVQFIVTCITGRMLKKFLADSMAESWCDNLLTTDLAEFQFEANARGDFTTADQLFWAHWQIDISSTRNPKCAVLSPPAGPPGRWPERHAAVWLIQVLCDFGAIVKDHTPYHRTIHGKMCIVCPVRTENISCVLVWGRSWSWFRRNMDIRAPFLSLRGNFRVECMYTNATLTQNSQIMRGRWYVLHKYVHSKQAEMPTHPAIVH